jgi:hypothetical protein
MFRNANGGFGKLVVAVLLAAVTGLVAVNPASAIPRGKRPHPRLRGYVKPRIPKQGLDGIGISVTPRDGGGLLIFDVDANKAAFGLVEPQDVIFNYGGNDQASPPDMGTAVTTVTDLDTAVQNAKSTGDILLWVWDSRDPNAGLVPVHIPVK